MVSMAGWLIEVFIFLRSYELEFIVLHEDDRCPVFIFLHKKQVNMSSVINIRYVMLSDESFEKSLEFTLCSCL